MSDTESVVETEEEDVAEPVEAPKEEETPEEPAEASEEEPEGTSEDEAPKPKRNVQKRISQLTRQRSEAQQEAAQLRQQLEALQGQSEPAAEPKQEDFQSFDEFVAAKAEHRAVQVFQQQMDKLGQTFQQSQTQAEQAARSADWNLKVEDARDRYDDFDEVAQDPDLPVSGAMAIAIQEADNGADIAYFLGNNPKTAREISKLGEVQAIIKIGQIGAKLADKPKAKPTATPKPVKTVKGAGSASRKDPSKMSQREYEKWRSEGNG